MIKPQQKVPDFTVPLINDTQWRLSAQKPEHFSLLVFYRGLHCSYCKKQLEDLALKLDEFRDRGVHPIAISVNSEDTAKKTAKEWDIPELPLGYEFPVDRARELGLYVSKAIKDSEPDEFLEPGIFLVRPDQTLYSSSIQSMPFARPDMDDFIKALDIIIKKEYPARGEA